eukprot:CAMPEP_0197648722 /NCGR_PEP_ID=MMETSP1338-20131121/27927_1 /TAXON_ID=43686 ORGANISM="Pelagodinium beii, Strain RCC1491" /NCGR_SAMPLE_ID=MMETSP1338 /ASSEMBLY_ACC=CAM_ASM_000754 /LENGTH=341 /DNA_ID=CAMNT_0043222771 /DNA_START=12 /DNA_END=1037 /DNA_ORIENTATION=+
MAAAASKALLALALFAKGHAAVPAADVEVAYDQFLRDFGKEYNEAEKKIHFLAFEKNYNYITDENAKNHSYKLGLNDFSDMPLSEFKSTKFGLSGTPWGGLKSLGEHKVSGDAPPAAVDWRQKNVVTPVKNQKACGSCWAFSTTGSLEGAWAVATGKLVSLSEQQLVDCAGGKFGNDGCSGGLMDNAFKYEEQAAVCTEESYPYKALVSTCKAVNCTVGLPKGAVVGYKDVAPQDQQALMDAVAKGPVSVAIEADQMAFQTYKSGVLTKTCGAKLDHGVLIVGYGTDAGKDYWIVKNSWGPTWGEEGFIRLERGLPGAGECGIKAQASYPVVKASEAEIYF